MLDPYGPVRDATFDCIQILIEPVKVYSNKVKEEEEVRKKQLIADEKLKREKEGPKVGELSNSTLSKNNNTSTPTQKTNTTQGGNRDVGLVHSSSTSSVSSIGSGIEAMMNNIPGETSGGLGFRTSSDSSFWEAIGDDTAGLKVAVNDGGVVGEKTTEGWGGGDGWDDGWGGDDLDELESEPLPSTPTKTTTSLSGLSPSPNLFAASPSFGSEKGPTPKKSVEERRQEAKEKRESRSNVKKLTVGKLTDDTKTDDWEW